MMRPERERRGCTDLSTITQKGNSTTIGMAGQLRGGIAMMGGIISIVDSTCA